MCPPPPELLGTSTTVLQRWLRCPQKSIGFPAPRRARLASERGMNVPVVRLPDCGACLFCGCPNAHYAHLPTLPLHATIRVMGLEAKNERSPVTVVTTDSRSRVVQPGRPSEMFILRENADGTILLEPAVVVSAAQREYDTTPELRNLLADAAASETVRKRR